MICFKSIGATIVNKCCITDQQEKRIINLLMTEEVKQIESNDDIDVVHEKRRLITAVITIFIGLFHSDPRGVREKYTHKIINGLSDSSMSIIEKKQIERMMAIPPEIDEIIALMNDMEDDYWDFFIKIINTILNNNSLSKLEINYLDKLSNECNIKSLALYNGVVSGFAVLGFINLFTRRKC